MTAFLTAAHATAGVWAFIGLLFLVALALLWACERGDR